MSDRRRKTARQVESKKTRAFCKMLQDRNAEVLVFTATGSAYGKADRFIAHTYVPGGAFVEFKDANTPVRTNQRVNLRRLLTRGTNAIVARFDEGESKYSGYFLSPEGYMMGGNTFWNTPAEFLDRLHGACITAREFKQSY